MSSFILTKMADFGHFSLIYINILSFVGTKERIIDAMLGKVSRGVGPKPMGVVWLNQGFFFYFSWSSRFSFPVLVLIVGDGAFFPHRFGGRASKIC